jgi:hypothetical protein
MVMKKLLLIVSLVTGLGVLVFTNPSRKELYIEYLAAEARRRCSFSQGMTLSEQNRLKTALSRLERQGYKLWFSTYTQPPRNYGLLTVYHTDAPGLSIISIGVAGKFVLIPLQALPPCPLPDLGLVRRAVAR